MKTTLRLLCALTVLILMSSCNSDGKYVIGNGTVYHTYWTFSFGTIYKELPGVDASSFESVKDWLGHDAKHAYFKDKLIQGADIATLKARKYPLCSDKNDYYYKGTPLKVTDVESFEILKWHDDDLWAKDSQYAYYDTIRIVTPDLPSFRVIAWNAAADSRYVYRYGKILPLADPETYVEDWKELYSRDKSHIWYCGELVRDADYETFTVDKDGNASDKYGPFHNEKRVTNEEQTEEQAEIPVEEPVEVVE